MQKYAAILPFLPYFRETVLHFDINPSLLPQMMTKNSRNSFFPPRVYLPIIFALILVAGFTLGLHLRTTQSGYPEGRFFSIGTERYNKIGDVINYIHENYVDTVSREHLTDQGIVNLLRELDPHSSYIPAARFQRLNDPLMGSFEGIGIEFNMIHDSVVVIHPIPGGPSKAAGIMPGDRIVMVEDTIIAGVNMATDDVVSMLLGEKGSTVNLSVIRPGTPQILEFTITRDKIPSFSLDIAYMVDDEIGYIRLNKFSATTYQEFSSAMNRLLSNGMNRMILDLRGNGGGFMDAAIRIADELLKPQQLIVYTEGKRRPRTYATSRHEGRFSHQPLIVLIDEWSASASEIIAGAVQDNDRGLVLGRRSFGKGLVQEQIQLPDGSALRLTVARYYTPTGRSIQKPYDEGTEAYYDEFMERYLSGEMVRPETIRFEDSLKFETPGGRIVYGGGGIMPDIYVAMNESGQQSFFNQVSNRGFIYLYAFDFTDRRRSDLSLYGDADNFIDTFRITDAIYHDFIDFLKNLGISVPAQVGTENKELIKTNLKAYIGRNMFGPEAFFPVLHTVDRAFLKAVETIRDDEAMVGH